jgi:hypothetical protein
MKDNSTEKSLALTPVDKSLGLNNFSLTFSFDSSLNIYLGKDFR